MARKSFRGALGVLSVVDPYGTKGQEPEGEVLITPGLEACRPDPEQPRQVLPPDLRDRLLGGASPAEVLDAAWERCLGEDLYAAMKSHALSPAEALERRREAGVLDLALQLTLEGLVELADSIARHGLRQPINVYDLGDGKYRIAEGERRWWAHVHLAHIVGRAEFGVIPARVHPLPEGDLEVLARQHAENVHRRDLSAVARARAIARVMQVVTQDFSGTQGSPKTPATPGKGDFSGTPGSRKKRGRPRATVSEHDLHDLTGRRLEELTGRGMSGRMVRNYLALLTLPPEAQALAEAAGLSEKALRPIVSLDDPAEQVRLVRALAAGEMTPAQVTAEAKRLARKADKERGPARRTLSRFRSSLRFAVSGDLPDPREVAAELARMRPERRAEVVAAARRYADFLEAFLEAAEGRFSPADG